ncbi:hypothetical protein V6N13_055438 [Hibiscus sabdariffa]|uniref:PLATZ transcription factor family protein n=1 Tax=Hibiscus sabdariffa TaxID=183260 RepID=A0ABR2BLQ0_9ROSI
MRKQIGLVPSFKLNSLALALIIKTLGKTRRTSSASIVASGFVGITYKINGEKAVHLNPRPQAKDAKPSTKSKTGAACVACRRYLQDPPNRFCSIACKVSAVDHVKPRNRTGKLESPIRDFPDIPWKYSKNSPEISTEEKQSSISSTDVSVETKASVTKSLKPRKRLKKRKGTPRRAPVG